MRKSLLFLIIPLVMMYQGVQAEEIRVGLEPFPPLITEDGKGYTIDMLRAIEDISDLKFKITIMVYTRAKESLKNGIVDLMGHTPYQSETKAFYEYAQEIDWTVDSKTDFYAVDKEMLKNPKKHRMGTPRGNKEFYGELLGIPVDQFYEGKLSYLLKMLHRRRSSFDIFLFERGSSMSTIKAFKLKSIHYKNTHLGLKASLAVSKGPKGDRLRKKLETYISKIDEHEIFKLHRYYLNLPDSGTVTW